MKWGWDLGFGSLLGFGSWLLGFDMAKTFRLEIVSPDRQLFAADVESLVAPAHEGYLGVLAGHAPLLCVLQSGEIAVRVDGKAQYFSTGGGFMDVQPKSVRILADVAERLEEIDVARAKSALEKAVAKLAERREGPRPSEAEVFTVLGAKTRAENRLKLAKKHGRPGF